MLTALRDAGRLATRLANVVDETGKRWDTADHEGNDGTPVASKSWRVAIDAVEVVHVRDGHVTTSHDKVALNNQINGYELGKV